MHEDDAAPARIERLRNFDADPPPPPQSRAQNALRLKRPKLSSRIRYLETKFYAASEPLVPRIFDILQEVVTFTPCPPPTYSAS